MTGSLISTAGTSSLLLCLLCGAGAVAAQTSQSTLKVLYSFKAQGGTPLALVEVSPLTFMGITGTSPGLFSITSPGAYQFFYTFPPSNQGIVAHGLAPALNGKTYGSANNYGPTVTFSELFSTAGGTITTYPYNGATQGGILELVPSPDEHLYTFFGGGSPGFMFSRLDYQGVPTTLYTFSSGQGTPYAFFLGMSGDFYGLSELNPEGGGPAGIFRLTPSGTFSWIIPTMPLPGASGFGVSLMEAADGNFYGTTPGGGGSNAGTIYVVTPSGSRETLYEFSDRQTGIPETLLQASDGMLYGTARGEYNTGFHGYSRVFRFDPSTRAFQTIYSFKSFQGRMPLRNGPGQRWQILRRV